MEAALATGDPKAAQFANKTARFLEAFGFGRDRDHLLARAQALAGMPGSDSWFLSRSGYGETLYDAGRFAEAATVLSEILDHLAATPSFDRSATLVRLARCLESQAKTAEAEAMLEQAMDEAQQLEASREVRKLIHALEADLADVLLARGDLDRAAKISVEALATAQEEHDERSIAAHAFRLGTIHYIRGNLPEAARRYRAALATIRAIGEPVREAAAWHQLGMVLQKATHWAEAEAAYREAGRIWEERGLVREAATTWNELARLMANTGHGAEAEDWFRKALTLRRNCDHRAGIVSSLGGLAQLLCDQPGRLADARVYAEQAMALVETLDAATAEVWKLHTVLAEIAEQEGHNRAARELRQKARESFDTAPIARETLRRFAPLIATILSALADPARRASLYHELVQLEQKVGRALASALRQVLDGARDADALCEPLDYQNSLIIATILRAIDDPSVLDGLLPQSTDQS